MLGLPCSVTKILPKHSPLSSSLWHHRAHGNLWSWCRKTKAMTDVKHWLRPPFAPRLTPSHHFCAIVAALGWYVMCPRPPFPKSRTCVHSSLNFSFFLAWGQGINTVSLFCDPGNFLTLVLSRPNLPCVSYILNPLQNGFQCNFMFRPLSVAAF